MNFAKISRSPACYLGNGFLRKKVINKTFKTSAVALDATLSKQTTQDASKFLTNVLNNCKTGCVFTGTGQYYQVQDEDRILMLNFAEDLSDPKVSLFEVKGLLDCSMKDSDIDLFMKNVKLHSKLPVYNGEVDYINSSSWEYGFTLNPFSIFSGDERICFLQDDLVHISSMGRIETVNISDISYIGLWVSEDPYNERKFMLGLKNQNTKLLIDTEKNNIHCDLATLTVDTEWMMKAAALFCVNLTRKGNKEVHLKVSPVLQPVNNQWVAMRQKLWIDMIQKNMWEKEY